LAESTPDPRPRPLPDEVSRFYWEGAAEGRLLVQRCGVCTRWQFPPEVACVYCQSTDVVPTAVSGRGTLYSYSVINRAFHEGFVGSLPYVVGLVELEEQAGLRLLTNIVGAEADSLKIGMPLEVTFEKRDDVTLPQFRPAGGPR
jgi:uncharacterized OB-fold protein